jgi:hypothetical protein
MTHCEIATLRSQWMGKIGWEFTIPNHYEERSDVVISRIRQSLSDSEIATLCSQWLEGLSYEKIPHNHYLARRGNLCLFLSLAKEK